MRDKLAANTSRFRSMMTAAGFTIRPGTHPIVPIMLGEARLAVEFARRLLNEGIYVVGFCYPVVPRGPLAFGPRFRQGTKRKILIALFQHLQKWRKIYMYWLDTQSIQPYSIIAGNTQTRAKPPGRRWENGTR